MDNFLEQFKVSGIETHDFLEHAENNWKLADCNCSDCDCEGSSACECGACDCSGGDW